LEAFSRTTPAAPRAQARLSRARALAHHRTPSHTGSYLSPFLQLALFPPFFARALAIHGARRPATNGVTIMPPRPSAFVDGQFTVTDDEPFDIIFARDFEAQHIELLEVSDELLKELLDSDGVIEFKGEGDDIACVCTATKTYQVKRVETSNQTLLVGPELGGDGDEGDEASDDGEDEDAYGEDAEARQRRKVAVVRAQTSSHLDLTEIAPKLDRLRDMLASVAYGGEGAEAAMDAEDASATGFTFEALDARVQASSGEIMRCLEDEHALYIDGVWRGVDGAYRLHVLGMLAVTVGGNGWPTSAIPEDELVNAMASDGFAPEVTKNTLGMFSTLVDGNASTWALDEERVCRYLAMNVLRDGVGVKNWRLVDMMDKWRAALNEINLHDVEVKEEYLAGLALIERPERATEAFVTTLIASEIPTEPEARFKALWAVKPRWSMAELEPYLKGQARPGETIESQLLKYTRVTQGATPMYSKR
jgi:sister chromatid cohesion protein DCC1